MSATSVGVAPSHECLRSKGRYRSCWWQAKLCDPLAISERFRDEVHGEALSTFFTFLLLLIIRPRRCRSAAAYSRQPFPWTICRSVRAWVRACVRASVGLSSALWKNGGSDPDAVRRHIRSDGSRDEAGSGVWDRSTGRGILGANLGGGIVNNEDFMAYVRDSARRGPLRKLLWADLF